MITILITCGALPPERRAPVLAALRQNLSNPLVKEIRVVTEAASAESMVWLYEGAGSRSAQLHLTYVSSRPSFAEMIRVSNEILSSANDTVALMNADISIATEADAVRLLSALETLDGREAPVVLALARHEEESGRQWLALYEPNGLPNTISADAWVFQRPLNIDRDLFYMLGQMNCDMLFAHDLLSTGHRLFNPCLDIKLIHHEPVKDDGFYGEKNLEKATQASLERHATLNGVCPWNYYGTPWVSSKWLGLGYRPAPSNTNNRRLILAVQESAERRLGEVLPRVDELIERYGFEVLVLVESDIDPLICTHATLLAKQSRIWFARPRCGIDEVCRAFLAGDQYNSERIAFVGDISRIDDRLVVAADYCIFLTLKTEPDPQVVPFGCTLVTSVFHSDVFIRGFIRNITELIGYDRLIEHVFLISTLSEEEIEALVKLQAAHPNVVMLWHRKDPGLYECWNIGIRLARTEYVSNANVDDLRHPEHVVTLLRRLEARPHVAVAATALVPFYAYPEDGSLPVVRETWYADQAGEFTFKDLGHLEDGPTPKLNPHNMPHCMPVWRRSLHDRFGWFDEERFGTYADWAFWLKALEDGKSGWLDPAPLSFYYVNPTSHNRRGANLEALHCIVEERFIPSFRARISAQPAPAQSLSSSISRKLNLYGIDHHYGQHRNSFNKLVETLEPLNKGAGGVRFVAFLERQFVWGDSATDGEAASRDPRPINEPWIGILHVPFDTPDWFEHTVNPKHFFKTPLFQQSLSQCCGLITLCDDLEQDLKAYLPGVPTLSLKHPTEFDVRMWDLAAYSASPCVIQVGDWLRKLQAIHRLHAPKHRRVMLLKAYTTEFMRREVEVFGDHRDPAVEMRELVPNDEYDDLLTRSVVLCLMYSTAANNVVIECIARATPIIVNPLPGVVEYLGVNYPLYASDELEAGVILENTSLIESAHDYLKKRRTEIGIQYFHFLHGILDSDLYKTLKA